MLLLILRFNRKAFFSLCRCLRSFLITLFQTSSSISFPIFSSNNSLCFVSAISLILCCVFFLINVLAFANATNFSFSASVSNSLLLYLPGVCAAYACHRIDEGQAYSLPDAGHIDSACVSVCPVAQQCKKRPKRA